MSNKNFEHYIAYCYKENDNILGFGNMTITNSKKLSIETFEDIKIIEDFVREKIFEKEGKEICNIVIMDFRQLEGHSKEYKNN